MVLIFLPTSDNKLLTQWKGPFEVLFNSATKIFLANMLKQYVSAETGDPEKSMLPDSEDLDTQPVIF